MLIKLRCQCIISPKRQLGYQGYLQLLMSCGYCCSECWPTAILGLSWVLLLVADYQVAAPKGCSKMQALLAEDPSSHIDSRYVLWILFSSKEQCLGFWYSVWIFHSSWTLLSWLALKLLSTSYREKTSGRSLHKANMFSPYNTEPHGNSSEAPLPAIDFLSVLESSPHKIKGHCIFYSARCRRS